MAFDSTYCMLHIGSPDSGGNECKEIHMIQVIYLKAYHYVFI